MRRVTLDFELPDGTAVRRILIGVGSHDREIRLISDGKFRAWNGSDREFTDLQSAIDFALGVERPPLRWWRTALGPHLMLSRGLVGDKWSELAGIYRQKHATVYKSDPSTGSLLEFDLGIGPFAERRAMLDCMDALVANGVLTVDEAEEIMAAGIVDEAAEAAGGE